jgi:hypothetical protein
MKPHIFVLLAFLLLGGMIVSPSCAAQYTTTAVPVNGLTDYKTQVVASTTAISFDAGAQGYRIMRSTFQIPHDSRIDFTLYYGNGSSVSGYIENHHTAIGWTSESVSIGGDTHEYTFMDVDLPGLNPYSSEVDITGYAYNTSNRDQKGFLVFSYEYGVMDNDLAAFYEVSNLPTNLVTRIDATSTQPFRVETSYASPVVVGEAVSKSPIDALMDWVDFAITLSVTLFSVAQEMVYWLNFFFIQNLLMTVSLYLALTMAYSFGTAKDMKVGLTRFFKFQKGLFEFILGLWNTLVDIISKFASIFKI